MRTIFIGLLGLTAIGCSVSKNEAAGESTEPAPSKEPLVSLSVGPFSTAAFSPDGQFLALGRKGAIEIWDVTGGKRVATGDGPDIHGWCQQIAFSPDGSRLATSHEFPDFNTPSQFHLWQFKNGNELRKVTTLWPKARNERILEIEPFLAGFSPDGLRLVGGNEKCASAIWDTKSGRKLLDLPEGPAATFSSDGKSIITVSRDGGIRHWDPINGKTFDAMPLPPRTAYIFTKGVSFALAANRVLLHDDYSVSVKDLKTGKQLSRLAFPFGVQSAAISPDGRLLVVAESHTGMHLFDANTGAERGSWDAHGVVIFSPDSKHVAWQEGENLVIRKISAVLATAKTPVNPEFSSPAGVPLKLELISKKSEYVLNSGGKSWEESESGFASEVEFEFVLTNIGVSDVTFDIDSNEGWDIILFGDGAFNGRWSYQTGELDRRPPIKLSPGQSHRISITKLHFAGAECAWLLAGKYTIYASRRMVISPPPKATEKSDYPGWVTLWSQPIQVKVIAR